MPRSWTPGCVPDPFGHVDGGLNRWPALAALSGIDLDHHVQRLILVDEGTGKNFYMVRQIYSYTETALPGECEQPAKLRLPDDNVGDEDVRDTVGCHHLGLAELGGRDPHGSPVNLSVCDGRYLVGFDVGTQFDTDSRSQGGRPAECSLPFCPGR